MYAAIASDLDGTLLDARETITPFTAATLRAAAARGVHLIIATGRHVLDVQRLTAALELPISLITSNGARVHGGDGTLLYADDVSAEHVRALVQPEFAYGTRLSLYLDDGGLCCLHDGYVHRDAETGFSRQCDDLSQHSGEGVAKLMYTAPPARLAEIEAVIRQRFGSALALTYSRPDYLEVMAPGVSKGRALTRLLARLDVAPAHCAAFGDGLNDVEMLQSVGHPFRMANASPRLSALLPEIAEAGHHDEAGVARQISLALGLTFPEA
ncbi:Cof-type HAD-IIB family hydrolase [Pseudogulbenkiania subflava]|uniref:Cof subfamily of IIB subfamily of haloacid dehalogenase superfamily/HAD-superfamily hydrolase, subfamily IIB n=1 Tax=Pseudogulbenkiania subflava DSM 22618 TaxID=1123014 RepID=A0A1Y6BUA6_9NEIS|nr:Cof-type HAD-IIB family hydrolase [Pseudogulbenkiania subflava]SMF25481.1 hypothetical protein SAMN02745746_02175 [Pseudogulbenkiania subflava DSM 22618]